MNKKADHPMNAQSGSTEEKLDFKKVLPILVVVLVDLLGLTIIVPLLPLYAASFRISPFMIGVLGASFPLMQLIAAPILGSLSDRYGRKPVLIASQIGTLIGFLLLGFANTIWLLFISRIIDGISGGNISIAQAMMSDSTTERTRTQGLGLIGAAFGIGFIIGPVIAFIALAASGNNYHVPAFIAAALSAASIIISWFWLPETHPNHETTSNNEGFSLKTLGALFTLPRVGLMLILMFVQQFAFGGLEQFLPLLTLGRLGLNGTGNAMVFVFVGIIVVIVQGGMIGKWSRKWGERKVAIAGLALLMVGVALTAATPVQPLNGYDRAVLEDQLFREGSTSTSEYDIDLPSGENTGWLGISWLLIAMIPTSIGAGMISPSINSMLSRSVPAAQRGQVMGSSTAFVSAANVIAPLFGGSLIQFYGLGAPFWCWAVVLVIALLLAWRMLEQIAPAKA
jgi:DHA1 family tetracycline resistance protein-like MFS transporter